MVRPRSRNDRAIQTHRSSSSRSGSVGRPAHDMLNWTWVKPVVGDRVERLLEGRPREGLGEDPQVHQTPPLTSASRTIRRVSTERAIATIACIAARPSSRLGADLRRPVQDRGREASIWRL